LENAGSGTIRTGRGDRTWQQADRASPSASNTAESDHAVTTSRAKGIGADPMRVGDPLDDGRRLAAGGQRGVPLDLAGATTCLRITLSGR
jgi:hypothetical protein